MDRSDRRAAGLALALSALTFAFGFLAPRVTSNRIPESWAAPWEQWDTQHYLSIASSGYPPEGRKNAEHIVFFPL